MPPPAEELDAADWRWEEQVAAEQTPALRRLPDSEHLPVIVATRMSVSFPLLISAIPLWTINRRSRQTEQATRAFREALNNGTEPPTTGLVFSKLWFTGFRNRIVRVLQTKQEGGLNLHMDRETINRLADRGRTAGQVMVEQFTEPRYLPAHPPPPDGTTTAG